ncbi:MAG: RluA family pseudouridine synthase [Oscillospiraceae bacterium]|nr:RluA family pseudouridine synthase [Oscillospiraceae bacterium]
MREIIIDARDSGTRLNRYLARVAAKLPASLMYKYLREKRIKLNGRRCEASARLAEGDILQLYIDEEFFELQRLQRDFMRSSHRLSIIYEDENMAALYKPAGLLSHGDKSGGDALLGRFTRYLYEKGEYEPESSAFAPAVCNRLDRGTEGIVLAAKNAAAAAALGDIIKRRLVRKLYLCVCCGEPPKDGVYTAYMKKDGKRNLSAVRREMFEGAREITTGFRTLGRKGNLTLLEASLITGRPHQIRAHLSFLGAPVLGDQKYGNAKLNAKYGERSQLLCAYSVSFRLDEQALAGPAAYLDGRTFSLKEPGFVNKYFK